MKSGGSATPELADLRRSQLSGWAGRGVSRDFMKSGGSSIISGLVEARFDLGRPTGGRTQESCVYRIYV